MHGSRYSSATIIAALEQMNAGRTAADIGSEIGVSRHTIYAWKAKYGWKLVGEQEKLREENAQLKKLVEELRTDRHALWRQFRALRQNSPGERGMAAAAAAGACAGKSD